ncbi:unnamed protein product [Mytilus coruscus]|uniref:PRRT1 n=1 Tax=Mytilus coruscus TaxID=42192 RepID=A0A6J8BSL2_MYTCO|nr:unnamed protein product [Mytilus coruscus]
MASFSEPPPPYYPSNQPLLEQQGQQYVNQFVQQNPHGFVQAQPSKEGFRDISSSYGYTQQSQMPPPIMNTTTTNVVVCQAQAGPTLIINPAPYSYMTPAILTCLFCCWCTGIAAIIAASMSQRQSSEMKYDEARRSANIARILILVTICCGIAGVIIFVAVSAAGQ